MTVDKIVSAEDIKPNFVMVKERWSELLSRYYNKDGDLNDEYLLHVDCPHCSSMCSESINTFELNGFSHHTCPVCECLYVSPRLSDECLVELYSDDYYSEMFQKSMIPYFKKRKRMIGYPKFNQISHYVGIKGPGDILDIGCGIGEVLDVFKDHGWKCSAVELNKTAVKWLESRDIDVYSDNFSGYATNKKFDVIMAWNVIEHVVDPVAFIRKAYGLLNPGGIFVSEVPHANSLLVDFSRQNGVDPHRILQGEQHILLYSVSAYNKLHESVGFTNMKLQTNGLDISTILNILDQNIDDDVMVSLQKTIDVKLYGDLLRGIWSKK